MSALSCLLGLSTTIPKPADYDGDGKVDPAFYDSASGVWTIYLSASDYQAYSFVIGGNGATAVPMDYDGDGKADPGVYDQNTGLWTVLCSASQYAYTWLVYGGPGCVAAPADFDGDRKADPTVYSAALGVWGTLHSASNYAPNIIVQGGPNCVPVPDNYCFTNRADYVLYNATDEHWNIVYSPVANDGAWQDLACSVLPWLIVGDWKHATAEGIGWTLHLIFHHGEDPTDPHWHEAQQIMSEMNGKLDTLLAQSSNIIAQLNDLTTQLEYDTKKTDLLISQLLADQAFVQIATLYDNTGPYGYRSFYTCDTNSLPSASDVATFVSHVLNASPGLDTCINNIKYTILPLLATEEGVLEQWVDMAIFQGVTPDNLLDHYQAFFSYFSTLYSYQMKAASLYVDALRQNNTSEWANAQTYNWITNTFYAGTLKPELDEYRNQTYRLIMAAFSSSYDPCSTSNQLVAPNVDNVLANLEFFSHQWLATNVNPANTLCATILTVNQPDVIAKYDGLFLDDGLQRYYPLSSTTNHVTGHAYGYISADRQRVVADNRYVFLRADFGSPPHTQGTYYLYAQPQYLLGGITVSNYDDNMRVAASGSNWFGHCYASPWNMDRIALPLDVGQGWSNYTAHYSHSSDKTGNTHIYDSWPSGLTPFSLGMTLNYNLCHGHNLPDSFCGSIFTYYTYPIVVVNMLTGLNVRADFGANNSILHFTHHFDNNWGCGQNYWFNWSGGASFLSQGAPSTNNSGYWLWQTHGYTEPKFAYFQADYSWTTNFSNVMLHEPLQSSGGQTSTVFVGMGGAVQPSTDCYKGYPGSHEELNELCEISYQASHVILSFY